VATGGFFGEITLRNYQLWQLGLLALVLRDINEGHQRVGAMKSRGLGRVKVVVQEFRLDQYGALLELEDIRIRGVGMNRSLLDPYDLYPDDVIDRPKSLRSQVEESIRQSFIPDNGDSDSAWRELAAGIIASPHWKHLLTSKQKGI